MVETLFLSNDFMEEMLAHVTQCFPEEGCGLAGGLEGRINIVLPVTNQLHSQSEYYMDPIEQYRVILSIEQLGCELLAIYHSHPLGGAQPSRLDIERFYYPGVVSLIWSFSSNDWNLKAFEISKESFREIRLFMET